MANKQIKQVDQVNELNIKIDFYKDIYTILNQVQLNI